MRPIDAHEEITNLQVAIQNIGKLLDCIEDICADIRERYVDDTACGLCEHDGQSWQECPGFERDDCFLLKKSFRAKYSIPNCGAKNEEEQR